jgi:hypothetical protein
MKHATVINYNLIDTLVLENYTKDDNNDVVDILAPPKENVISNTTTKKVKQIKLKTGISYNTFKVEQTKRLKNDTDMDGAERKKEISRIWKLYKDNGQLVF